MYFFISAPHLLRGTAGQKAVEVTDILFDAGFDSKEEAESFGVRPGDTIVPQVETIKTANGKTLFQKLGIIVMAVRLY